MLHSLLQLQDQLSATSLQKRSHEILKFKFQKKSELIHLLLIVPVPSLGLNLTQSLHCCGNAGQTVQQEHAAECMLVGIPS